MAENFQKSPNLVTLFIFDQKRKNSEKSQDLAPGKRHGGEEKSGKNIF